MRRIPRVLGKLRSASVTAAGAAPAPVPEHLISLSSAEGVSLLAAGGLISDYLRLMPHYVAQENPKFCGPATMAICLNALYLPPRGAWPQFTQESVFTPETEAVRSRGMVAREGMGLAVFARFVEAHGGRPEVHFAGDSSLGEFRALALDVLADHGRYLAVNYLRTALGQEGRGHTSPLAAYDEASDRFLVLDVAGTRCPPVWVAAGDLFDAMNTRAGANTRGFSVVGRG